MRYVTLFPEAENVHLTKDVGMIPYIMHQYFGYEGYVSCYKNGEYGHLNGVVSGLKIDYIAKITGNAFLDGCLYLAKNARNIDVLQIFHASQRSLAWAYLYRLFKKNGKVYLKLDAHESIKRNVFNYNFKSFLKKVMFRKCTLISTETKDIHQFLNDHWPFKVEYIPNGFFDDGKRVDADFEEKENIISTVGRIGTEQKATEILMEGFRLASDQIPDWKLKIIGPIKEEFKPFIAEFFSKYPETKDKIIFTGSIEDRKTIDTEYRKTKIFCLSSRWEGFPLVFLEAVKAGCYIISTDMPSSRDITDNGLYGALFEIDNPVNLSELLVKHCSNEKLNEMCSGIQEYAYRDFYWPEICKKINECLNR